MATQEKHITQYAHNRAFIDSCITKISDFPDWYVTANFYSALHIIEAIFATKGIHNETHAEAEENFAKMPECKQCFAYYKTLKRLSRKARYLCIDISNDDIMDAQNILSTIEIYYNNFIKSHSN